MGEPAASSTQKPSEVEVLARDEQMIEVGEVRQDSDRNRSARAASILVEREQMTGGIVQERSLRGRGNRVRSLDDAVAHRQLDRIGCRAVAEALAGERQRVDTRLVVGDDVREAVDRTF